MTATPTVTLSPSLEDPAPEFEASLWRSPGGSLYLFDGSAFTCIAVHSGHFAGWVGKRSVKRVWRIGAVGGGLQAFRNMRTGALVGWVPIALHFAPELITKHFPAQGCPGALVYGRVERYVRCGAHDGS